MKRQSFFFVFFSFLAIIILMVSLSSCDKSEGLKYGILQKVSHKQFPCSYYVAEFAFEGGRVVSDDNSSSHSNSQEISITKEAYDTLQNYLGDRVIFDYRDRGFVVCGESKQLTFIKRK